MKQSNIAIVVFGFLVVTLSSCVTQRQMEYGQTYAKHDPVIFENEDLSSRLSFPSINYVNLQIKNNTDNVITLVVDLSSFTTSSGDNNKLVTGETRVIDSNKSQPVITIPPQSNFTKDFYLAGSDDWVPNNLSGSSFVFGYRIKNEERFIIYSGDKIVSSMPKPAEVIGKVEVKKTFWNIFYIIPSVEERRRILHEEALKQAKEKYGENIVLKNLIYEGNWSPLSIILLIDFGFVEDATLSADVVRQ